MEDRPHKGEAGASRAGRGDRRHTASSPAEAQPAAAEARGEPAAADEESTAVMADADDEVTQVAATPARRPSRLRGFLIGLLIVLSLPRRRRERRDHLGALHGHEHRRLHEPRRPHRQGSPGDPEPERLHRRPGGHGHRPAAARSDALPPKAQLFAGPITGAIEDFIKKGTQKVLSSPKAYELVAADQRVGHEKVVALLRGEPTAAYIQGSDVNLNLLPLVSQVLVWADGRLPGGLSSRFNPPVITPDMSPEAAIQEVANWSGKPLPSDFGQITLLQSDALGPAQTAVKWFDRLTWILPLVTAVLIALTIWLSRRRGRTAIAIGIGAAIAIFLTRVIVVRGVRCT